MTHEYSRRLEEVVVLHRLEDGLRDIFVEGATDRALLQWFVDRNGLAGVHVWDVNDIHFPSDLFVEKGLANNSRAKVYALADALEKDLSPDGRCLACIADADLDRILGCLRTGPFLLHTDYTCMEMYYYNTGSLERFLSLFVRASTIGVKSISSDIIGVGRLLFSVRVALAQCKANVKPLAPDDLLHWDGSQVVFNRDKYLLRMRNIVPPEVREQFSAKRLSIEEKLTGDSRHWTHGDDWIGIISWLIRKVEKKAKLAGADAVGAALRTSIDGANLLTEPLFLGIAERMRR